VNAPDQLSTVPGERGTPAADLVVTPELIRSLVLAHHADLAELPLAEGVAGWDNVTFRLGDRLAVRLPRRRAAAELIEHEQRWLPVLAPRLGLAVPVPVRTGPPTADYPFRWSIVPWFDGDPGDLAPPAPTQATVVGRFLRALHTAAPPEAPVNPYRGIPLAERLPGIDDRLAAIVDARVGAAVLRRRGAGVVGGLLRSIDTAALHELARAAAAAPRNRTPVWLHGDLHPRNLVVRDGRIVAVLDWGDVTAGDPATDLASAWMLFDGPGRAALRTAYGRADDDAVWLRARGWAVLFGAALLATGLHDDDRSVVTGSRTLSRVLDDEESG
jgi:aminoglycoside phosphotransferase (APT) family kinase protein